MATSLEVTIIIYLHVITELAQSRVLQTKFVIAITGAIDRRLSSLETVTIEGWVDAGWRHEQQPIITIADLASGSLDSLRIHRTAEGMHTDFTWREAHADGGQRYICTGGNYS